MDPDETQVLTRTGEFEVAEDATSDTGPTPQWEADARYRLAAAVDRFTAPLNDLLERDANEGDTRMWVADFLSEGLGYNKYDALTTEYRTQGESIDYGLRIRGELFAFLEVKRCGQDVDARSLRPARTNAAEEGVEWLLLTNGRVWRAYHLSDDDAGPELVLEVDLFGEDEQATLDALFHLTREAVAGERLEGLRRWHAALTASPLAEVLLSEPVIATIRAQVRERTGHVGHLGDTDDVTHALTNEILRRRVTD
ncbi:hypothetical protein [Salinactinospora qingdaonensis]|uniref:Type I restriction enzyme R protein N terminus (HSDR_N) n=1 Tax=Salinactinospora qingdaonensis TaxID=702744 RepID=A0ABP7GJ29_9ACTN